MILITQLIAVATTVGLIGGVNRSEEPVRLCLVSGSWEYNSEESLKALSHYLESEGVAVCTLIQAQSRDNLPGLEALDTCDVALFFTRRLTVQGDQLERVQRYARSGRPIIGIRTASHGFQNWLGMDQEIFGGNYSGHFSNDEITYVHATKNSKGADILRDVQSYESSASLYKTSPIAQDCTLLLIGQSPEGREPLAWTRKVNNGRVFYTSLGHPSDFANPNFRKLLANAVRWVAGAESQF